MYYFINNYAIKIVKILFFIILGQIVYIISTNRSKISLSDYSMLINDNKEDYFKSIV